MAKNEFAGLMAEVFRAESDFDSSPNGWAVDLRLDFSHLILHEMHKRKLTQQDVADMCKMKSPALTRIIHNKQNCTFDTIAKVMFGLGIRPQLAERVAKVEVVSPRDSGDEPICLKFDFEDANGSQEIRYSEDAEDIEGFGASEDGRVRYVDEDFASRANR